MQLAAERLLVNFRGIAELLRLPCTSAGFLFACKLVVSLCRTVPARSTFQRAGALASPRALPRGALTQSAAMAKRECGSKSERSVKKLETHRLRVEL